MRGFIVVAESYPIEVNNIALTIESWLPSLGFVGTADWYYDEFNEDGTEYGVKLQLNTANPEQAIAQMHTIWRLCLENYPELELTLEIGQ